MTSLATRPPLAPPDPVTGYAQRVLAGEIVAGRLVRLACERHLRDLEDGGARGLHFDAEAAAKAVGFFRFLRQRKGEWGNLPLELQPWQVFRVGSVFGWKRADGTRRFRTAYNEVARKNGKTTEAAGVGLLMAFFDGEPGAEVYAVATKREQARFVWAEGKWMATHRGAPPVFRERITALVANLNDPTSGSKFEPLGMDADSTDGLNPHSLLIDELHAWKSREFYDKLTTAMGARRQPLIWIITTAGADAESICGEQHAYAIQVLEGVVDDDSFFAYIACFDDEEKWRDPAQWALANPNLGVSVKLEYLEEQAAKAEHLASALSAFLRYHGDIWSAGDNRWITGTLWDAQAERVAIEDHAGERCWLGLDLSSTQDITAWVAVFERDGGLDIYPRFYVPEERVLERANRDRVPYDAWVREGLLMATEGSTVRYEVVRADILAFAEAHQVVSVGTDKWNAIQLAGELKDAGLVVVEIPQFIARLTAPTKEVERLLLEGKLRHGGDRVLRWMAGNAVAVVAGDQVRLDKAKSREKIDGMAALVNAVSEYLTAVPPEDFGDWVVR